MAKKRPQSKSKEAYNKEIRRIKRFISRAEKRGYQFEEGVVPKKPKKITPASVRRLKKITPDYLYRKAVYGGEATAGEIVSGKRGRVEERKQAGIKSAETRRRIKDSYNTQDDITQRYKENDNTSFYDKVSISHWYAQLREFANGEAYGLLRAWMGGIIAENGEHNTATMINNAIDHGVILTWEVVYDMDEAERYIGRMIDYLPEAGVIYKEQQLDKIEFMKRLGDALEQDENWAYPL